MNGEQTSANPKLCECGCGQPTLLVPKNNAYHGWVKGQPFRFLSHHRKKVEWKPEFWEEVEAGYESPCWFWQRARDRLGYGRISRGLSISGSQLAHIELWFRTNGPVPIGLTLDHLCRNPSCIRPDHLEPVTHAENLLRGKGTKLTRQIADEIRDVYAREGGRRRGQVTYAILAERYGVEKRTIWSIVTHRRWT